MPVDRTARAAHAALSGGDGAAVEVVPAHGVLKDLAAFPHLLDGERSRRSPVVLFVEIRMPLLHEGGEPFPEVVARSVLDLSQTLCFHLLDQ